MSQHSSTKLLPINPTILKLEGDNYDVWKVDVEMMLIRNKLWSLVSGKRKRPTGEVTSTSSTSSIAEAQEDYWRQLFSTKFDGNMEQYINTITSIRQNYQTPVMQFQMK